MFDQVYRAELQDGDHEFETHSILHEVVPFGDNIAYAKASYKTIKDGNPWESGRFIFMKKLIKKSNI